MWIKYRQVSSRGYKGEWVVKEFPGILTKGTSLREYVSFFIGRNKLDIEAKRFYLTREYLIDLIQKKGKEKRELIEKLDKESAYYKTLLFEIVNQKNSRKIQK